MTTHVDRARRAYESRLDAVHVETDRVFFWLLLAQWALALVFALLVSPYSWAGKVSSVHLHVKLAVVGGALINSLPLLLIRHRPGWWLTRHVVATAQMLWSAMLIFT